MPRRHPEDRSRTSGGVFQIRREGETGVRAVDRVYVVLDDLVIQFHAAVGEVHRTQEKSLVRQDSLRTECLPLDDGEEIVYALFAYRQPEAFQERSSWRERPLSRETVVSEGVLLPAWARTASNTVGWFAFTWSNRLLPVSRATLKFFLQCMASRVNKNREQHDRRQRGHPALVAPRIGNLGENRQQRARHRTTLQEGCPP